MAPFDAAAVVLLVGGAIIATTWTENTGESTAGASTLDGIKKAARLIYSGGWLVG